MTDGLDLDLFNDEQVVECIDDAIDYYDYVYHLFGPSWQEEIYGPCYKPDPLVD